MRLKLWDEKMSLFVKRVALFINKLKSYLVLFLFLIFYFYIQIFKNYMWKLFCFFFKEKLATSFETFSKKKKSFQKKFFQCHYMFLEVMLGYRVTKGAWIMVRVYVRT
jgi:hypothetical protein